MRLLLKKMEDEFELTLLVTSSLLEKGYEKLLNEIKELHDVIEIPLADYSGTFTSMSSEALRIGREGHKYLVKSKPDAVLLWADRWELLPMAQVASYLSIPIIHLQGGEISGNIDDKVRNAVSQLSDIHFCSHVHAKIKLGHMGLRNVYDYGCPSIDLIKEWDIYRRDPGSHLLCMFHPHTKEIQEAKIQVKTVVETCKKFAAEKKLKFYIFAPNNDPGFHEVLSGLKGEEVIRNLPSRTFLELLADTRMVVGNSSCLIRECSYLGIPGVLVGERQKGREMASNVVKSSFDKLRKTMEFANVNRVVDAKVSRRTLYGNGSSCDKIIKKIKDIL
jgi:UDP-hydrolysing UDP-N-acetyl-D-glucosamine 2-epimerase